MAGHRGGQVRRFVTLGLGATGVLLLTIQAIPYGRRHDNSRRPKPGPLRAAGRPPLARLECRVWTVCGREE
jgi:hypothetical protein